MERSEAAGGVMVEPLVRKLRRFQPLTPEDIIAMEAAFGSPQACSVHSNIVTAGDHLKRSLVVLSGWAARYKILRGGERQIVDFLLPGDFLHLNVLTGAPMDHSLAPISPVTVAYMDLSILERLGTARPNLARAAYAAQCAEEARLWASLVSLGQHDAEERLGHMLCDTWARANAVGMIKDDCLDFPPTQVDVGDRLGLTSVHVNRVMQRMRADGVISLNGRSLRLPDFDRLARLCGYEEPATGEQEATATSDVKGSVPRLTLRRNAELAFS